MKVPTQGENQEINKNVNIVTEIDGEEMEIGDIDLDGLEGECSKKIPEQIPPKQVLLLEKAIIKEKNINFLGIMFESLKDPDGEKEREKIKMRKAQQCANNTISWG